MRTTEFVGLVCTSLFGLLVVLASGCRRAEPANGQLAADKPHLSRTELFNLRSECAKLAHKVYADKEDELRPWVESKNYAWFHDVSLQSNYDAESNRCFAELTTKTTDRAGTGYEAWSSELYDAQKNDLIAVTRHQVSAGSRPAEPDSGQIFVYSTHDYKDGYEGTSEFIADSMREVY